MDTTAELLEAIESQGWKIIKTAHGYKCTGCLYAALNGISLVSRYSYAETTTGYTGPGQHEATITRKDTRHALHPRSPRRTRLEDR